MKFNCLIDFLGFESHLSFFRKKHQKIFKYNIFKFITLTLITFLKKNYFLLYKESDVKIIQKMKKNHQN